MARSVCRGSVAPTDSFSTSGSLLRKEDDSFNEYERLVFMNCEINQERTNCTVSDLESQGRQAIERLAKLKGTVDEAMTNFPSCQNECIGTVLLAGLLVQAPKGL